MSTPTPDYGEPWGIDELKKPWNAKMPCGHLRQYGTLGEYAPVHCLACENANLNKELAELREWKRQQLEVERQWDCQKVGKLLGVPLGANIREHIELSVTGLVDYLAQCEDTIKTMNDALKEAHRIFGNLSHVSAVKYLCPDFAEVAELVRKSHDQHA